MAHTGPSQRKPLIPAARIPGDSRRRPRPLRKSELWIELTRQRAQLLLSANAAFAAGSKPELCSDPADQASMEQEQDLVMHTKARIMAKLRGIERALELLRNSGYGRCRRCHEDIPYKRLKVQPDALFCVDCLTIVEQDAAGS